MLGGKSPLSTIINKIKKRIQELIPVTIQKLGAHA